MKEGDLTHTSCGRVSEKARDQSQLMSAGHFYFYAVALVSERRPVGASMITQGRTTHLKTALCVCVEGEGGGAQGRHFAGIVDMDDKIERIDGISEYCP